jgi:hypothetical protein
LRLHVRVHVRVRVRVRVRLYVCNVLGSANSYHQACVTLSSQFLLAVLVRILAWHRRPARDLQPCRRRWCTR